MRDDSRVILSRRRRRALYFIKPMNQADESSRSGVAAIGQSLRRARASRIPAAKALASRVSRPCNESAHGVRRAAVTGIAVPNEADIVL
jgi:hypothetical protein